jgi:hypothetical protein
VRALHAEATLVEEPQAKQHPVRDPDDAYLLTLAQSAKADCLVSGDGDLTSLEDLDPPVLTPAEFLANLEAASRDRDDVQMPATMCMKRARSSQGLCTKRAQLLWNSCTISKNWLSRANLNLSPRF